MKKEKKITRVKKLKIGDRVFLRIPHNGRVDCIYRDGSIQVELDEITPQTLMVKFYPKKI